MKTTEDLPRASKMDSLHQQDAIHRKVIKTRQRFIDEDDMDFDEAAESAMEKQKFLLNWAVQEKLLPTSRMMTKE